MLVAQGALTHAWVELDGRVVGDDPRYVATFTPLGALDTLPLRWR
ncbi:MAG TPA: lasso peptide biosynthesis protein [Gemmatimonadales bacterium]